MYFAAKAVFLVLVRNSFGYILLATLAYYPTAGQGLCDSEAAIENGFSLPANVGCSPFNVKPTNLTDWTDVKYVFGYTGQDADQLPSLNPQDEDVFFTGPNGEPRSYTVLQFGKDTNGEEKYSCQVVTVRENNKPKFSYTVCNGTEVTVNIPQDLTNDFDYYEVEWGSGDIQTIIPSELSFERKRTLPTPSTIRVEGFYNTPLSGCSRPGFIDIPRFSNSQFPDGFDKPFHPNIEKLELISGNEVELTFTGNQSDRGYELNIRERGALFPETILSDIKPGSYTLAIPEPEKSYCFHIIGQISCGIEMSAEICTNPITELIQSEFDNTLSWGSIKQNQFVFPNQPQFGRNQNTSLSLFITENEQELDPEEISTTETTFEHSIECQKQYCYQLSAEINGQLFYHKFAGVSLSEKICVDRAALQVPSLTNITASFLGDDQKSVSFVDNSLWTINREKYYLFEKGNEVPIDSTTTGSQFLEFESDGDCFSVSFLDECGSISDRSPEVCVVKLSTEDEVNLNWTSNNPFSLENISEYEVLAMNELSSDFEYFSNRSNAFLNLKPDLESFTNQAKFKVRVLGSAGGESYSNAVSLPLEFKVFLPEVVTPNNDGINDFLELKGSLLRAEELKLLVFDRWGRLQFESSDIDAKWYPDEDLPIGKYIYRVDAKLLDGSPYEKNGVIQIAR